MPALLDAIDALAAALSHFYERNKPFATRGAQSWKSFIAQHPDRIKKKRWQLGKTVISKCEEKFFRCDCLVN